MLTLLCALLICSASFTIFAAVKKFFLSILTIIYMTVSSGFAMEIHYCMGKKAGVEFYKISKNRTCSKCGMKDKKGGCCSDEHKFYKLADAHKNITNDQNFDAPFVAILTTHNSYTSSFFPAIITSFPVNNSPPDDFSPHIYLRNCNFRL